MSPEKIDWQKDIKYRDMIRNRSLRDYESMLGFNISSYAISQVLKKGSFRWVDMCCAYFKAGKELTDHLVNIGMGDIARCVEVTGIDVCTLMDAPIVNLGSNTRIYKANVVWYHMPKSVDLITCLRGLRYVEEYQKQGALAVQKWFNRLPADAVLIFDCYEKGHQSVHIERGDIPIMAGNTELVEALRKRLGDVVVTYRTKTDSFTAFVVKINKEKENTINLFR
jgi:hypothetical protein